jgi:hypothetical protein
MLCVGRNAIFDLPVLYQRVKFVGYMADSACFTHALLKASLHIGDESDPQRTCLLTWPYTTNIGRIRRTQDMCTFLNLRKFWRLLIRIFHVSCPIHFMVHVPLRMGRWFTVNSFSCHLGMGLQPHASRCHIHISRIHCKHSTIIQSGTPLTDFLPRSACEPVDNNGCGTLPWKGWRPMLYKKSGQAA